MAPSFHCSRQRSRATVFMYGRNIAIVIGEIVFFVCVQPIVLFIKSAGGKRRSCLSYWPWKTSLQSVGLDRGWRNAGNILIAVNLHTMGNFEKSQFWILFQGGNNIVFTPLSGVSPQQNIQEHFKIYEFCLINKQQSHLGSISQDSTHPKCP